MAQKLVMTYVCDLCESEGEAGENIEFSFRNTSYEVDLCPRCLKGMVTKISTYTEKGRKLRGRAVKVRRGAGPARSDLGLVRRWGKDNGFKVSDRGRVSAELQSAYDKAH